MRGQGTMIAPLNTLWAAALVASMIGNVGLFLSRAQTQADLARAEMALAAEQADRARERAQAAQALTAAAEQSRQTEAQWRARHQEVLTHAQIQIRDAAGDAALARDAAGVLRKRAEVLAGQCAHAAAEPGAGSSLASAGQTAPDAAAVLADLLGRLEAAGRELAAVADARGVAGTACEQAYDAVAGRRRLQVD